MHGAPAAPLFIIVFCASAQGFVQKVTFLFSLLCLRLWLATGRHPPIIDEPPPRQLSSCFVRGQSRRFDYELVADLPSINKCFFKHIFPYSAGQYEKRPSQNCATPRTFPLLSTCKHHCFILCLVTKKCTS